MFYDTLNMFAFLLVELTLLFLLISLVRLESAILDYEVTRSRETKMLMKRKIKHEKNLIKIRVFLII